MDIETIQTWLPIIKDAVTTLAALMAAVIGIIGLQTWKKQLRGKTEYELAQRLAKAVYRLRNALWAVRSAVIAENTFLKTRMEDSIETEITAEFEKRRQEVLEASTELESLLLEAQAIWGASVQSTFGPFQILVKSSQSDFMEYMNERQRSKLNSNQEELDKEDQDKIFDYNIMPFVGLQKIVDDNVRTIEDFLKPYLKI